MPPKDLLSQMTLPEKVALCSGADYFHTKAFEKYGIPGITLVDGPHGLRKQLVAADHLGINQSIPSTCFPTASLAACSWDRDLLREMGAAIGQEALQEKVALVLGPSVNIKRNPLCGRNFEYYSEDPFLAGELAASWVHGLQSQGVAASLKHFALNNQENLRMASDSLVDERTLREIYLPAFERVVKQARPAAVMAAYNRVNGTFCSEHPHLLRDILRDEWGFAGLLLTDWGAIQDRIKAFAAGMDLEMPGSQGYFDQEVIHALRSGKLPPTCLDDSAERLLDLILSAASNSQDGYHYDLMAHHLLAKNIALQSAVLLKNVEGILPLRRDAKIALIGALARYPRYQGTGSSHIQPTRLSSAIDGFDQLGLGYAYYPGYSLNGNTPEDLLSQAVAGARSSDVAVIFAGLPETYEIEGLDRTSLDLPDGLNTLISRVAQATPNTVVVLQGGAPVEMPWLSNVKALLNMYLSGQAGGLAVAELLTGVANPSGKLAETYPIRYADVPSADYYAAGGKQAQYREGIYVGYRYYDKAQLSVLFPFGFGLSYTTFAYQHLSISKTELFPPYDLEVSATIKNTGHMAGAEVVQMYIGQLTPAIPRPVKELKQFAKLFLQPGEARRVSFRLDARAFSIYDPRSCDWVVPDGDYQVSLAASSRDIRLHAVVKVHGRDVSTLALGTPAWYFNLSGKVTQSDFESLLGRKIEPIRPKHKGEYSLDCSFQDMQGSFFIRLVSLLIKSQVRRRYGKAKPGDATFQMVMATSLNTPLNKLCLLSPEDMPRHVAEGIVHLANGRIAWALRSFLQVTG